MDPKTPNFNAYDFLGYFFPGAFAILFLDASIAYHTAPLPLSYDDFLERYSNRDLGLAIPFLIISYISGHFLSYLSSLSLERYALWMYGHPSKYLLKMEVPGYFSAAGGNLAVSRILRAIMWVLLLPVTLLDLLLGTLLGLRSNYISALDPLLRDAVWRAMDSVVSDCGVQKPKELGNPRDHEFWKLAVHFAVAQSPNHHYTLRNYVVLYGFLRTLALIFVGIFWVTALHVWSTPISILNSATVICFSAITSFAAYASFVKFFQRYHEEALFAITVARARNVQMSKSVTLTTG